MRQGNWNQIRHVKHIGSDVVGTVSMNAPVVRLMNQF